MSNFLQKLLEDVVGTKRGQAIEASVQPTLTALTPLAQDLVAVAVKNDPQLGVLITNGETIANAINNATADKSAPATDPTAPTESDMIGIVNNALAAMGVPLGDDSAFDQAVGVAYAAWQAAKGQVNVVAGPNS